MKGKKLKIIVVVGPTASGKSGLAVDIAKKYGGEVISADSRQIYKKLDIGTAKITKEEMKDVPHHLIDIIDVETAYSAADFKKDAEKAIKEIVKNQNIPIIAGGTFFYIDTLVGKIITPEVSPDKELRDKLEKMDVNSLFEALLKLDPQRAEVIDQNNKRRIIRALEIVDAIGKVPQPTQQSSSYDVLTLGIRTEKEELRARFCRRAENWLRNGFIKEVKDLLASGISTARLSEIGFEYKIGIDLVEGALSEEDFIEVFKQKNWQYAKRQLTWLKRDDSVNWVYLSEKREIDLLIKQFLIKN